MNVQSWIVLAVVLVAFVVVLRYYIGKQRHTGGCGSCGCCDGCCGHRGGDCYSSPSSTRVGQTVTSLGRESGTPPV